MDQPPPGATIVERGEEALDRLRKNKSLEDWLHVGRAFWDGSKQAMLAAGTNQPAGKAYILAFNKWLQGTTSLRNVDAHTRAALLKIIANEAAILAWRSTLPIGVNHPRAVWGAFRRARSPRKQRPRVETAEQRVEAALGSVKGMLSKDPRANADAVFRQGRLLLGLTPRESVDLLRATLRVMENSLASPNKVASQAH